MGEYVLAVTSDNHLAPCAWTSRPELRGDAYYAFQQTIDWCLAAGVPLVLAGDICDTAYPDPYTVWFMTSRLEAMLALSLPVYYVRGQHDGVGETPWLQLVPGAVHVHRQSFRPAHGSLFYGLDYTPADRVKGELARVPEGTKVLVAHQCWEERMGKHAAPEAAFRDVPRARCVITGDFHGHGQDVHTGADGQEVLVVSPGSQCLQEITEDALKYFYAMKADGSFESVPLRSRERHWFTFRSPAGFEAQLAGAALAVADQPHVPEEIARPIVVAEFAEAIPDAKARLQAVLAPKAHLFTRPLAARKGEGHPAPAPEALSLATRLHAQYHDRPQLYAWAKALLTAEDPRAELARLIEEFMSAPPAAAGPWAPGLEKQPEEEEAECP
jgi:hypothetical protein